MEEIVPPKQDMSKKDLLSMISKLKQKILGQYTKEDLPKYVNLKKVAAGPIMSINQTEMV